MSRVVIPCADLWIQNILLYITINVINSPVDHFSTITLNAGTIRRLLSATGFVAIGFIVSIVTLYEWVHHLSDPSSADFWWILFASVPIITALVFAVKYRLLVTQLWLSPESFCAVFAVNDLGRNVQVLCEPEMAIDSWAILHMHRGGFVFGMDVHRDDDGLQMVGYASRPA
jgi:hypothetical protein